METSYITAVDSAARLTVRAETAGVILRSLIDPGQSAAIGWVPTDLTGHPQEVQDAAAQLWTPEVVDAFKLANPYVAPPVINLDATDLASINAALTQPGTVTRAMGEILFGVIKGTIAVTPSLTKPMFIALLKQRMR